jgi:hypothetical protein
MRERAESRLKELRDEFGSGQVRLRELELEEARLRETLLRISGAIQVLQELLDTAEVVDGGLNGGQEGQHRAG